MSRHGFYLVGLSLLAVLGGCRYKGAESFVSATEPTVKPVSAWKGDVYAGSGLAESSGGQATATRYSAGSRTNSTEKFDPTYNRPAYGSGGRPGEMGSEAAPGHAFSNSPSLQGSPNAG